MLLPTLPGRLSVQHHRDECEARSESDTCGRKEAVLQTDLEPGRDAVADGEGQDIADNDDGDETLGLKLPVRVDEIGESDGGRRSGLRSQTEDAEGEEEPVLWCRPARLDVSRSSESESQKGWRNSRP